LFYRKDKKCKAFLKPLKNTKGLFGLEGEGEWKVEGEGE